MDLHRLTAGLGRRSAAALVTLAMAGFVAAPVATASAAPAKAAVAMGPEGIPLEAGKVLAPASTSATGRSVDGISCQASEQVAYHVHTHLAIYVNGESRALPAGIGLVSPVGESTPYGPFYAATNCYYWLHVHAGDGVIHIESPTTKSYTLGQFFDEWRQPLSATQVGPAKGKVTVYLNGRIRIGNPRTIVLGSHVDIQLDVGSPVVAFQPVNWSRTSL